MIAPATGRLHRPVIEFAGKQFQPMNSLVQTPLLENIQNRFPQAGNAGCRLRTFRRMTPRYHGASEQIELPTYHVEWLRGTEARMFAAPMSQDRQDAKNPL